MNLPAVDQLHNACIVIEDGKKRSSEGFLMIGSALSLVLRNKLWVDSHKDFGEFCTSVGISRSYSYKLIQAWERFGDRAKGIEPHRLLKLLPLKVENEEEVLEQARELTPGSWADRLRELKGQTPSDGEGCEHDFETRCKHCGRKA